MDNKNHAVQYNTFIGHSIYFLCTTNIYFILIGFTALNNLPFVCLEMRHEYNAMRRRWCRLYSYGAVIIAELIAICVYVQIYDIICK